MGNAVTKVSQCFATSGGDISRRHDIAVYIVDPLHEGLGYSFCYIPGDEPVHLSNSNSNNKIDSEETTTSFFSISGASVSANTSTRPSTSLVFIDSCTYSSELDRASTFESSDSFASIPLQPVPRGAGSVVSGSGPIERGFLSGPIERGFLSGPIDRGPYSGPIDNNNNKDKERETEKQRDSNSNKLPRSYSHVGFVNNEIQVKPKKQGLIKTLKRVISNAISGGQKSLVASLQVVKDSVFERRNGEILRDNNNNCDVVVVDDDDSQFSMESQNLQWAQGKAGEDRVHIVISEEHGWVFVGIYDGFNGPDAPDFLLSNLYNNVHKELKGLLWNEKFDSVSKTEEKTKETGGVPCSVDKENYPLGNGGVDLDMDGYSRRKRENKLRYRCKWERETVKLDWKSKEQMDCKARKCNGVNHFDVLKALSKALRKTENDYLEIAELMAMENPELSLMGSCVLVMLMKGEDVYLMNVGDSRAVLAQKVKSNIGIRKGSQDLEIISEESMRGLEVFCNNEIYRLQNLKSLQLTMDHTTCMDKEVQRIRKEHPDDASAVVNDRVKGYLKVTRAFGVGFLKQPKWNDLLLEMFRIDYIGTAPYVTCFPSLYHRRLSPRDKFLILSSDGLYQYFTNEEAVSEVELFLAAFPEGDPAQHLIEEVLFRAAKKAGMDFHELLDVPQGDRRRYHDDVSVIIISLEGRIWRSSV